MVQAIARAESINSDGSSDQLPLQDIHLPILTNCVGKSVERDAFGRYSQRPRILDESDELIYCMHILSNVTRVQMSRLRRKYTQSFREQKYTCMTPKVDKPECR